MPRPARLAILAVLLPGCALPSFSVTPRLASTRIDGHVAVAEAGAPLASNSLGDALGLSRDSSAPGVRFDADFGSPVLTLAYGRTEDSGSGTLENSLSDNGITLPAGASVASDVQLDLYSALLTFDVLPSDMFELGLGFGAHLADVQASISGAGGRISIDEAIPIPVVALRGGVGIGRFDVSALLSGMKASIGDSDGTFYDVDLAARFRLFDVSRLSGSIAAGWRQTRLAARVDDNGDRTDFDLKLSGPYLGLTLGF